MGAAARSDDASRMAALVVLSLGVFVTLLDVNAVNVALPQLIDGIGASLDEALWIVNAYVVAFGVFLITAGRLGDIYGPRTLFLVGMAVFTAASGVCGLVSSPGLLVAARAVQGFGAALLTPQPLAIIFALFPHEQRGRAFAINGVVGFVAAMGGPALGGLIVTQWEWRGIFFINLPVGLAAVWLTLRHVPDLHPGRAHRLDLPGVLVGTLALVALSFGLLEGQRYGWGTVWGPVGIPEVLAVAAVLAVVFWWMQRRRQSASDEPLVPFTLFRDRNYALMVLVGAALQLGICGISLPFTLYAQSVLGFSALGAGVILLPHSLVSMLLAPYVGRWVDRWGGKWVLVGSLTLFAAGIALLGIAAGEASSWWAFLPGAVVMGFGTAGLFAPLITVAMAEVPPPLAGAASGLLSATRQMGAVVGTAVVGALLQNRLAAALADEAARRIGEVPVGTRVDALQSFRDAGRAGLEVGAGQSGAGVHLPPGTPADVAERVARVAQEIFGPAFVSALHATLVLPVAALLVAALMTLAVRHTPRAEPARAASDERPAAGEASPA